MKKCLIRVLSAVVFTSAIAVGVHATNANADGGGTASGSPHAGCSPDTFCVWTLRDGKGWFAKFTNGSHDLKSDLNGKFNRNITSYYNNTTHPVRLCSKAELRGRCVEVPPLNGTPKAINILDFDNQTSSIKVIKNVG